MKGKWRGKKKKKARGENGKVERRKVPEKIVA